MFSHGQFERDWQRMERQHRIMQRVVLTGIAVIWSALILWVGFLAYEVIHLGPAGIARWLGELVGSAVNGFRGRAS